MPKHDPPGDDAALLDLERELMQLDRAIHAAEENRVAIDYALFDRRGDLMARIFNTPAAGLAGLAVQARAYLSEREVEFADSEGEGPLDFPHMGAVLAHGILTLAHPHRQAGTMTLMTPGQHGSGRGFCTGGTARTSRNTMSK
jgi:hypothetical protein